MLFRPRKYCELFISNLFPSFFSVLCVWKSCYSDARQSGLVLQLINLFSNHLSLCIFYLLCFLGNFLILSSSPSIELFKREHVFNFQKLFYACYVSIL